VCKAAGVDVKGVDEETKRVDEGLECGNGSNGKQRGRERRK